MRPIGSPGARQNGRRAVHTASWLRQHRLLSFTLDGVFFVWLIYTIVSGSLLPQALIDLIHPPAPVVAALEPIGAPYGDERRIELPPEA